jgi:hypothetical protein
LALMSLPREAVNLRRSEKAWHAAVAARSFGEHLRTGGKPALPNAAGVEKQAR